MPKNLWDRRINFMYIKVGSFFLVALFIFFITLLSLREINIFKGSYVITVKFDFAEGLRVSSPVRFCGVDVGEVKKVVIKEEDSRPLVFISAKIQSDIKIPKNSYFFINSLSLFGEKYLEIDPSAEKIDGYIETGDTVEGVSPVPLFGVFATFTKTMKELSAFVKEGKIKTSLENTLGNIEDATLGIKELITDMRNKQGTIGRLLYDDSLYKTTEEFIRDLKEHPWKLLHKPKR